MHITLYALRMLWAHDMCNFALQSIYRSIIIAKLLYVTSAWWGFALAIDKQRINAFLWCGQCPILQNRFFAIAQNAVPIFSFACHANSTSVMLLQDFQKNFVYSGHMTLNTSNWESIFEVRRLYLGQGHWERKCRNHFLCISSLKVVDRFT